MNKPDQTSIALEPRSNPLNALLADWHERKKTLVDMQVALAEPLQHDCQTPRVHTLRTLMTCLREFGERQLGFFIDGFDPQGFRLVHDPIYLPEYALQVTENQISHDLDVILRCIHHRSYPISPLHQAEPGVHLTLADADGYACALLQAAVDAGLNQPVTALTYYQKSLSIRGIPYAPVALIGIPFSATHKPRDLALIAHEVGHYVFWRKLITSDARDDNFQERLRRVSSPPDNSATVPAWIDGWWEEIFADVYGCLVGGPASAFTLLEMLRGLPADRWLTDDGEHPIPVLRPTIYVATLRKMAAAIAETDPDASKELDAKVDELEQNVTNWLGSLPAWLTLSPRNDPAVSVEQAKRWLCAAVQNILAEDVLGRLLEPATMNLWREELHVASINNRMTRIIHKVREWGPPPELVSLPADKHKAKIDTSDDCAAFVVGMTGLDMQWERARDGEDNVESVLALGRKGWNPWWLAVVSASFWTTEGPGTGNPQPVD